MTGIHADRRIDPIEIERLQRWIEASAPFAQQRPFSELVSRAQLALADGVLTDDEIADLLFVAQKLTTVNPHYDMMRSGIQVLHGLLAGVSADRVITDPEVVSFQNWIESWSQLRGLWPYHECDALVTAALADPRQAPSAAAALLELSQQLPIGGHDENAAVPPVISGICAVSPEVTFANQLFVFTGDSRKATREEMQAHVQARGGDIRKGIRAISITT